MIGGDAVEHCANRREIKGEWLDPNLGKLTFEVWTEQWASTVVDLRDTTLSRDLGLIRNHLIPRFGLIPLARLTPVEIRGWIAELQHDGTLSPATVRKIGQMLTKILASAVDAGLIARSPASGLRLPSEPTREMRFLSPVELEGLAGVILPHYGPLVLTAAYAGLRWGELAGLRPERVDVLRRTITVVEQLTEVNGTLAYGPPKTAAGRRSVAIPPFLASLLSARLCEPVSARSGLVFPSAEGTPLRRSNFRRRAWLTATRRAGLEGLRFHDLRHTAVAFAIAQGAHPKAIQQRMGHSSVSVTLDRYGHLFPALDEAIADGLERVRLDALAASPRPERGPEVFQLAR